MLKDKDISCAKGDLAIAKLPSPLHALSWNVVSPAIVAVLISLVHGCVAWTIVAIVAVLISLVHGWVAWTIVATVAIGVAVACRAIRKKVSPYVIMIL